MNWFDILLLGLAASCVTCGYFRGLVRQLFNLFGLLFILAAAFFGSRALSGDVARYLNPLIDIPYQQVIQLLGMEAAAEQAAELTAAVLLFLLLFMLLSLLWRLFSRSLQWINKIPVIGLINRLGGAAVGLVIGAALAYLLVSVLQLVPLPLFADAVNGSAVADWVKAQLPQTGALLKQWLLDFYLSAFRASGVFRSGLV